MGVEVRTITADELEAWGAAMSRGFLAAPPRMGRLLAAPSTTSTGRGARSTATASSARCGRSRRSSPCPGGAIVPSAALTNVTVASTHRRQGLLRRMLDPDLAAAQGARRAGRHADRRRVPHLRPLRLRVGGRPCALRAGRPHDPASPTSGTGTVELVDAATLRREAPALYERFRRTQPGAIARSETVVGHHASAHDGAG